MTTKQRIAWYREGGGLSLRRLAMRKRARMKRNAANPAQEWARAGFEAALAQTGAYGRGAISVLHRLDARPLSTYQAYRRGLID